MGEPLQTAEMYVKVIVHRPVEDTESELVVRYLGRLVADLGLPVKPRFQFSVLSDGVEAPSAVLTLGIHGLRVAVVRIPDDVMTSLAGFVCYTLYRCRELFVNDEVARCVWSNWFDKDAQPSETQLTVLREALRDSVRWGFRIERIRAGLAQLGAGGLTIQNCQRVFEESVAEPGTASIRLFLSREQYSRCFDGTGKPLPLAGEPEQDFAAMLDLMSDGLFWELGVLCRLDKVAIDDELQAPWFRIEWNDVQLPPLKGLGPEQFLVNDSVAGLEQRLGEKAEKTVNPASGSEFSVLRGDLAARARCQNAGLITWGPERYVMLRASAEIRRNAGAFVSMSQVGLYLAQLSIGYPELVEQAEGRFPRWLLSRIFRVLLDEELSVRDLRLVLDTLLSMNSVVSTDLSRFIVFKHNAMFPCPTSGPRSLDELAAENYADAVRVAFRRFISYKYTVGHDKLLVFLLEPEIETRLAQSEVSPFSTEEADKLLNAVHREVDALQPDVQLPAILTTQPARRGLRRLVRQEFERMPAIAYEDLSPELNIQPIARITW